MNSETQPLEHDHSRQGIAERLSSAPSVSYLKDGIYGAIDGAVTTFAVVSGVAGAGLSPEIVIVLGVANLIGDGFSMAAGNFLGTRAENQQVEQARDTERRHIELCPEGEREEVRQILASEGFEGELLEKAVAAITRNKQNWLNVMLRGEYGFSGTTKAALPAATMTFLSFLIVGAIPLAPFAAELIGPGGVPLPFIQSSLLTAAAFLLVGGVKSRFVAQHWFASALETLAIGSGAAGLAYACGYLLRGIV